MRLGSMPQLLIAVIYLVVVGCGPDPAAEWILQLKDPDAQIRCAAVLALEDYHEEPVIAAVAELTDDADREVRQLALAALGLRGERAIAQLPRLEQALQHDDPNTRLAAAFAISKIDSVSESYASIVIEALHAGEPHAFLELGEMGANGSFAVSALIELLSHRSPRMRALSAMTLGQLGPAAVESLAALRQAENDPQENVRKMARQALALIESPR